jgi:soluble lytic murein transglycosylase
VSREDQIALWQRAHATERLHDLARSAMGADLGRPPTGAARRAWAFAYPRPYRTLVETEAAAAGLPPTLIWAVMRQESSFDADVVSTADARGLLQLLPTTAARVARELGVPFQESQLDVPMHNVRLGARYLGALLTRYRGQAVLAIAAYNGGPHAVDGWLDAFGDRPTDEFVERIPFDQTRNYVRRVTSAWARYRYLYEGDGDWPFEIPLTLVRDRAGGPDY